MKYYKEKEIKEEIEKARKCEDSQKKTAHALTSIAMMLFSEI